MSQSFYVTTPIYYVNDRPHIGHAYTTVLADVLTRYHRMKDVPTHFLTGVDEHGQKVQQAAAKRDLDPKKHVDEMVVHFQDMAKLVNASNDDFIRTTEPRHTKIVQQLLQTLYDKGEIYKKSYGGWYCEADEIFVQEKDLTEVQKDDSGKIVDALSPSGRSVEWVEETNYFFKMGQYRDWLIEYIESHPEFILPTYRANETLGFLKKQELEDLCISRPVERLSWGIPLPFDDGFVTYVWFDALTNYISAIGYGSDQAAFEARWGTQGSENGLHLIGKDILTTHTVYWPTMLHAAGIPLPKTVFAHGWWLNADGTKGSKTDGAPQPEPFIEHYGVDAFRYHLMADMVLGQDSGLSRAQFNDRYNADLVNNLGNAARRLLELLKKNFDGELPSASTDADLQTKSAEAVDAYREAFDAFKPHAACQRAIRFCSEINTYIDTRAPWKQAKEDDKGPLAETLVNALEGIRVVSGLLYPILPGKMTELRQCLGLGDAPPRLVDIPEWGRLGVGTKLESVALFPRQKPLPEPKEEKSAATAAPAGVAGVLETDRITYEDFLKVQLRTAKIDVAERVEGADKLLRLEILLGEERRQIVAGIAEHYDPATLPGKTIVVVANLKPAKIRKVESNGMLLAARDGDTLRLVTLDGDLPPGAPVK